MAENNQAKMLAIGTILHGTYRIERYLSSGGFGNTYVATNIRFDDVVAIKEFFMKGVSVRDDDSTSVSVSTPENAETFEQQKNKFMKEARRLHNIHNKHIVQVHDLFEEFGTVYYVMDYIDGISIRDKLKEQDAPFTEAEVLAILPQILDALQAVHAKSIYHLDLKPANIMLEKDGTAKLIDFGASKQLSQDEEASTSTGVSYTNGYAPTEQMERNIEKMGPWTDFYALGATLYNMLTCKKPPMPSDISIDESKDKHESLSMPRVSIKMQSLVIWLMQPNRTKRPQSVEAIEAYIDSNFNEKPKAKAENKEDEDDATVLDAEPSSKPKTFKEPTPNPEPSQNSKVDDPVQKPKVHEHVQKPADTKPHQTVTTDEGKSNSKLPKILAGVVIIVLIVLGVIFVPKLTGNSSKTQAEVTDSTEAGTVGNDKQDNAQKPSRPKTPTQVTDQNPSMPSNPGESHKENDYNIPTKPSKVDLSENKENNSSHVTKSTTLNLGYGTWHGDVVNGKPDGNGTLTFNSEHQVDRSTSYIAEPGDYFKATYDHGYLVSGTLYGNDGTKKKTIIP